MPDMLKAIIGIAVTTLIVTVASLSVSKDKRFDSNVFYTYPDIYSPFVCGMLCLQSSRCEAINFRTDNKTCFLVDQKVSSLVVDEIGYVSSDISDWSTSVAGHCKDRPCDNSALCVPGSTTYSCITAAWAL